MRRITILNKLSEDATQARFRCIFWNPVPPALQKAFFNPDARSVLDSIPKGDPAFSTPEERVALREGVIFETDTTVSVDTHDNKGELLSPDALLDALEVNILEEYDLISAQIAGRNEQIFYGTIYSDEDGWVEAILS